MIQCTMEMSLLQKGIRIMLNVLASFTTFPFSCIYFCYSILLTNAQTHRFQNISYTWTNCLRLFFLQNVSNFDFCQKYQKTLIQYKWFKIDFTIFALKLFTQYFVYVLDLQSKDYVFIIPYLTKSKFLKQVSFDRGFILFLLFNVTGTFLRS